MKKFWLSLMGLTVITTTSLTTISCGTQALGWNGSQYWMVLDYQGFHDWMKNVDLISQDDWDSLLPSEKKKSWETVQNVDLNNFMTIMNLTYNYLLQNKNDEKPEPKIIDELGGFYNNFGFAILEEKGSFANRLSNLKYQDKPLIGENLWCSLTEDDYYEYFKKNKLENKFIFYSDEGEELPIEMSITTNDGKNKVDERIIGLWQPIAEAISLKPQSLNSEKLIEKLWNSLKEIPFEAFKFNLNLFWPIKEENKAPLQLRFEITLTFDI